MRHAKHVRNRSENLNKILSPDGNPSKGFQMVIERMIEEREGPGIVLLKARPSAVRTFNEVRTTSDRYWT